jgi:fido (protein-threonine AMPylation protein)
LKLFDCPKWILDDDAALPGIAQAASAFVRFLNRQNPKRYILTHGDVKEWHRNMFRNAVPVPYYAGNYRSVDGARPCLNTNVQVAGALGAPAAEVESFMKQFSDELEGATKATDGFVATATSPMVPVQAAAQIAAFAGGSIIKIHPFVNGNGRMARMVMNFFLHRYLNRVPFYIDRPTHPDYSTASMMAMQHGQYGPLYQYLVELLALNP